MSGEVLYPPRVFATPAPVLSLGDQGMAFCERNGIHLDPEQEMVFRASLGVREDGRWQSFEVGLNVPRQNGKGEVLMARELFGLFELGERLVVHSAHEFKTAKRHFARLEATIRGSEELLAKMKRRLKTGTLIGFRYGSGDEAIELQSGALLEIKTRTRSALRGYDDVSLLVLDEAMILTEDSHGAMIPTVRASTAERGPQIFYAGSAADQEVHDHAVVWARVRERGIAGDDPALTYAEWSLDFDHPDEVPDEVRCDHEYWKSVNFAIGRGRVLEEHMEREFRSMLPRSFIVELLGIGDWPVTDGSADLLIDPEDWASLEDQESVLVDPICIAFDVTPDRRTAIVAAGASETGKLHVEVISARHGTAWVAERIEELYRSHEVVQIVCDGLGPSMAIAKQVDAAGITVKRMNSTEYAESCGLFADHVAESLVVHLGQQELTAAVRGARARPLVDRWAWSRTKSVADVGPLVAASLAIWSAVDREILNQELAIF